ncbi:MAG: RidA family protein [candidate division Zixibacteria bacterium]|nr:RidA family protein [candidate division Zixibacteria bacterium]
MSRRLISSASPFEQSVGFSRAVRVGNLIEVAGTAPIGPDGATVGPGDAYQQTRRCLEIIRDAITQAGGRLEDVVRTRVFITDVAFWEDVARAHGEFFSEIRPAATMVVISQLLNADWVVEIEATAVCERA